jgi:hypothetical protein
MKTLLATIIIIMISTAIFAQDSEVIRLSDPVQETDTHVFFGTAVDNWNTPVTLQNLIDAPEKYSGKEITVKTEIAEVCQKKGCFFVANAGSESARITFKDYSFFIPTDSKGKTVTLIGNFEVTELTEEQAKHYAEDAGQDPDMITGSQKEYTIVATSVLVPKS